MNHYGQYIITDNPLVEFVSDEIARKYRSLAEAEATFKRLKEEVREMEDDISLIARGSGASLEEINKAKCVWQEQQSDCVASVFLKRSPCTVKMLKAFASTDPPNSSDYSPMPGGNR